MAKRTTKKRTGSARRSGAGRTRKPQKTLSDLFHETLKDIYFAENKILKTLPKMAKAPSPGSWRAPSTSICGKRKVR